ncbi:uncharacterized protein SPPG_03250 [Spizellomyces punctatus DAOM BR117]|uniref:Methionine synthase reductase n=1 Tax=Spizellomyces punctatus (strain DAOM BR117) TaxID=645134 RepID=A0A0L0HJ02_SPIPD|nr:uncharacterized protein SPPG_03250 [Spizellomyces punctatus DAOM BR117]KND01446.1 hypothetical protein SPPG_03250 [Spizellomyces punctatus DAOM BR117]|eukprot:XP_016609485.1 hypothetical protein SPPG_03250 [Spizellomyces punctatus DAOM BR117]
MTADLAESLAVLFASQTGNAEWIAKHIHEEALARGYISTCHSLDDHAKANLTGDNAIIIVASTTGDGDPPDNATKFWRWLRRAKAPELEGLKGKKYAILGLGDTNYSNFCNTAKRLEKKMTDVGAVPFTPRGFADDATGLEAVVDPWIETLWKALPQVACYDEEKAKAFEERAEKDGKFSLKLGAEKKSVGEAVADGKKDNGESANTNDIVPKSSDGKASAPVSSVNEVSKTANGGDSGDKSSVANAFLAPLNAEEHERLDATSCTPVPIVVSKAALESATQLTNVAKIPTEYLDVELEDQGRPIEKSVILPCLIRDTQIIGSPFDYTAANPFKAKIAGVRCLTGPKALKRVLEIELNITGLGWEYAPGDAFGIVCPNPDGLVLPLLKRLSLEPTRLLRVTAKGAAALQGLPFETKTPVTVYEAFKYYLDLHSLPKKSFLRVLAEHTSDPTEKKTLYFLASAQGAGAYRDLRPQQSTLLDILHTFPNCQPPLARLLETLPHLQPRYYSVATSRLVKEDSVTFAFNTVEYRTPAPYNKPISGLCSTWLDVLTGKKSAQNVRDQLSDQELYIPIFPKPISEITAPFRLPEDPSAPVIMIAAGTGITPFMSFLAHRHHLRSSGTSSFGAMWLFHGRRFASADGDALYESDLDTYVKGGSLSRLLVCTSREDVTPDQIRYKYVQDGIRALGTEVWDLVHECGAYVYVCGSVAMAKEVNQALADIIVQNGGAKDGVEALTLLADLGKKGRYLKDIWT